jgi:hypothetical protein
VHAVPAQHSASDAQANPSDLQHEPLEQLSASKQQSAGEEQRPPAGMQQESGKLVMDPSGATCVPVPQMACPQQLTPPVHEVPVDAQQVVPPEPAHMKPVQQSSSPLGQSWPLPLQQSLLTGSQLPLQQSVPTAQEPTFTPWLTQQYALLTHVSPPQHCASSWQSPS